MTPSQASLIIGCTTRHVRHLIHQGLLEATYEWITEGKYKRKVIRWDITLKEARRYAALKPNGGRARSKPPSQ